MLDPRLTEQRNPASRDVDTLSPVQIVDLIAAEDASVPQAVARARTVIHWSSAQNDKA
jgi:N-acetylmuramic acid 6-phosphate (MurNAc-6-P) etherase